MFVVATALAIGSALGVVLSGNPFHSALSLILNLVALATFYLLLQADFLAAAQVIVYAGAVMIMFLFVTAYLGGRADEPTGQTGPGGRPPRRSIAAVALVAEVIFAVGRPELRPGRRTWPTASARRRNVGTSLPGPLPAGLRGHLDHADGGRRRRRGAGLAAGRAAAAG